VQSEVKRNYTTELPQFVSKFPVQSKEFDVVDCLVKGLDMPTTTPILCRVDVKL